MKGDQDIQDGTKTDKEQDIVRNVQREAVDDDSQTNVVNLAASTIHFVYTNLRSSFFSIFVDWTLVIRHPFEAVFKFCFAPMFAIALIFGALVMQIPGIGILVQIFWDPTLEDEFKKRRSSIECGLVKLTTERSGYDGDIARTLLLFSATMYGTEEERHAVLKELGLDSEFDFHYLPVRDSRIGHFSAAFEVHKEGQQQQLSNQVSAASKFTETHAIIISFRGTSPSNMNQWLLDCSMNKADAHEWLYGSVHEGFFNTLFHINRGDKQISYLDIVDRIKEAAALHPTVRFNVWVTGHSLGAALATLFFLRIRDSDDLTSLKNIKVCGSYTFGSPRVGNLAFRNFYTYSSNNPVGNKSRMYRIQNANDAVPHIPLGFDDPGSLAMATGSSGLDILDYCHVGVPSFLHHHKVKWIPDSAPVHTVGNQNDFMWYYWTSLLLFLRVVVIADIIFGLKALWASLERIPLFPRLLRFGIEAGIFMMGMGDHRASSYLKNLDHFPLPGSLAELELETSEVRG